MKYLIVFALGVWIGILIMALMFVAGKDKR